MVLIHGGSLVIILTSRATMMAGGIVKLQPLWWDAPRQVNHDPCVTLTWLTIILHFLVMPLHRISQQVSSPGRTPRT
ncbi:hypothetical protein BC827DRAFT_612703 [Russula dissimulans]|nr:hypothetical protein BC827DRAFT_612703 [Russula dissimulans]